MYTESVVASETPSGRLMIINGSGMLDTLRGEGIRRPRDTGVRLALLPIPGSVVGAMKFRVGGGVLGGVRMVTPAGRASGFNDSCHWSVCFS